MEGDPLVVKYHEDAAGYYNCRIGITTSQLMAEASMQFAYGSLGVRLFTVVRAPAAGISSIQALVAKEAAETLLSKIDSMTLSQRSETATMIGG